MATGEIYYSLPSTMFNTEDIDAIKARAQSVVESLVPMVVNYEIESSDSSSGEQFLTLILQCQPSSTASDSVQGLERDIRAVRGALECADCYEGLTIRLVRHLGGTAIIE